VNDLVAGNHAPSAPDLSGGIYIDQGHNLIGDGTGGSGFVATDLVGTSANPIDPRLGPLQNNGGPTQTMALLPGSPAIDAGDSSATPGLYDQRGPGYPRIVNGAIDIGAFESHILAVQNTNDSGPGSLRQAILDANNTPGGNTITFLPGVTGAINLASALPALGSNIDLEGPGALSLTVQPGSGNSFRVFTVGSGAVVTLAGFTIANGTDAVGGGIMNAGGSVTVSNCTITGNTGGGIDNAAGTLTLSSCTVASNSGANGGGVINAATLTLSNSTIAGNSATGTASGGGIDNIGTLTLSSCTIAGNSAGGTGGGVFNGGAGTVTLHNTLVAQNQAPTDSDVAGVFASQGHNLVGDGSGGSGFVATDLVGTSANPIDPRLGPLQNNGGPTSTLALLAGSPAIDAGDNAAPSGLYDQRGAGFRRLANGTIDIGAFEFQVGPPTLYALNTNDAGAGSLRQTILAANALPGDKVITFAPGVSGTIALVTALPDLSGNTDVQGPGLASVTAQGGFRVVNGAAVTFSGLSIGSVENADGTLTVDNCALGGLSSSSWEEVTVSNCSFGHYDGINIAASALGTGGVVTVSNCTFTNDGVGITLGAGTMTVSNCSIATADVGIRNSGTLVVNNSNIHGCAGSGVSNAGTATITNSTIAHNSAGQGGGVYNTGTLTLTDSTVAGNTASSPANGSLYGIGGSGGGVYNTGTLTLTNSTVAGNTASGAWTLIPPGPHHQQQIVPTAPARGGGIWNSGTLVVASCTIASNSAIQSVGPDIGSNGGGIASAGGTVTVENTILAQNTSPNAPDGIGAFVSEGDNLIGNGTGMTGVSNGANGDRVGNGASPINARLAPLGDNGGPTQTMALLTGSIALGTGGPTTTLAGALDATATSVSVANAALLGLVLNSTALLIDGEQMLVVGVAGNTLTVQRGFAGTTAAAHAAGAPVYPATDQRGQPRLRSGQVDVGAFQAQTVTPMPAAEAFVLAPDQSLWEETAGYWLEVSPAGTILSVSTAQGWQGLATFAVASDQSLWEYLTGAWSELSPAGTILSVSAAAGEQAFAVPTDHSLWEHSGSGWQMLSPAGTILSVSAGSAANGAGVAFALTSDASLWEYNPARAGTGPFKPDGWALLSPAGTILAVSAGAQEDVFALASDQSLWEFSQGAWTLLSPAGTILSIQAGTSASGADVVFALASDHSLWQNAAGAWAELSPAPTITAIEQAQRDAVFVTASDGSFWEYDHTAGWVQLFPWMTG
jgi:hypothetical protein